MESLYKLRIFGHAFSVTCTAVELGFLSIIELADWAIVAHDTRIYLALGTSLFLSVFVDECLHSGGELRIKYGLYYYFTQLLKLGFVGGVVGAEVGVEFLSCEPELGVTPRTIVVLSGDVPVLRAYGECRGDGDVGELVVGYDFSHEIFAGLGICESFSHVEMEHGSSCVLALEIVLVFECFECIVREVHGKLGGVGIIRIVRGS